MDTPTTNATILSREALLKVRAFASSLQCALVRRSPLYGLLQTHAERQHARSRLVQCSVRSWNPSSGRYAHVTAGEHARDGLGLSCCLLGAAESCEQHPNDVRRPAQNNFAEASRFHAVHSLM
jgi:hypothetical protein